MYSGFQELEEVWWPQPGEERVAIEITFYGGLGAEASSVFMLGLREVTSLTLILYTPRNADIEYFQ